MLVGGRITNSNRWIRMRQKLIFVMYQLPIDVISVSASEVERESSLGDDSSDDSDTSSSEDSSGSEPPASEVSDQHSMLEHAYNAA